MSNIEKDLEEKFNDNSIFTREEVENIIYNGVTTNLIQYNINYYEDEFMIRALQILTFNYIKRYE